MASLTQVFVDVLPDMKNFDPEMRKKLRRINASSAGKRVGDGFGSGFVGSALKRLGGLAAAFGGLKLFETMIGEAQEARKATGITEQLIRSTGGAAKITAGQVGELAQAISNKTAIDDEQIQANANVILTFKNVRNEVGKGNDIFNQAVGLTQDMATALGTDARSASVQLGKALNDPIKGVTALSRAGVQFTEQQKEQIRTLVESGDLLGAQKIVIAELAGQMGGAAEAAATPLDKLKVVAGNLAEQVGTFLLPYVDDFATFLGEKAIPRVAEIATVFKNEWIPRIKDAAKFIQENSDILKPAIAIIGGLIAAIKIVTVVTGIWNAVMRANPLVLIASLIAALVIGVIAAYKRFETFRNIVQAVWKVVQSVVKFAWENVIRPVFGAIGAAIGTVIGFITKLRDTFKDIWAAIRRIVRDAVKAVVGTFLGFVQAIIDGAAKAFGWVPGLGGKLKKASKDFAGFRQDVNKQLDKIADEDVVIKLTGNTSFSGGARSPALAAAGGAISGPGTGTSDSIPARLSNGEHVLTAAEVRAAGGHGAIYALRSMIKGGGLRRARGGPVDFDVDRLGLTPSQVRTLAKRDLVDVTRAAFIRAARPIFERLTGPLGFARSQAGKPYIWGGVGPRGYDCSGFMSAILNVIQGRNPYSRRGSTGTFPWSGFARGAGRFMIGSFRGSPGHMAGTLFGVNVESRGGEGVVVGSRARGARHRLFGGNVWHLRGFAGGGAVEGDPPFDLLDPRGRRFPPNKRELRSTLFDTGGFLPPGVTLAVNRTGRHERVLGPDDRGLDLSHATLERLAEIFAEKAGTTVNGPLIGELKAWTDRFSWPQVQDEMALRGVS